MLRMAASALALLIGGCRREPEPDLAAASTPASAADAVAARAAPDEPASESAVLVLGHTAADVKVITDRVARKRGAVALETDVVTIEGLDEAAARSIAMQMTKAIDAWVDAIGAHGRASVHCMAGIATVELVSLTCDATFERAPPAEATRDHDATIARTFAIDGATATPLVLGQLLRPSSNLAALADAAIAVGENADDDTLTPWRAGVCTIDLAAFWLDEPALYLSAQPSARCSPLYVPWNLVTPMLAAPDATPLARRAIATTTTAWPPVSEPAHLQRIFRAGLPRALTIVDHESNRAAGRVEIEQRFFTVEGLDPAAAKVIDAEVRAAGRIDTWAKGSKGLAGDVYVECAPGIANAELVSFSCDLLDERVAKALYDEGEGGAPANPTPVTRTFAIDGATLVPIELRDLLRADADLAALARAVAADDDHAKDEQLEPWRTGECKAELTSEFMLGEDALVIWNGSSCLPLHIPYAALEPLSVPRGALHRCIALVY